MEKAILLIALAAISSWPGPAQDLPWFMRETAMADNGRLTFLEKPWWPQAKALKEGESFTLDLNKDGRPDTMIVRKNGHIVEAIDDNGRGSTIWDGPNTAYVVSFKGSGVVDRMLDYIDNNDDGKYDEMELRHYQDGYLRYTWFGENYDNDGIRIFDIRDWSYAGNNAKNKFRGNLQLYLNKYDPVSGKWMPLSECPFAFWDYNKDGHGDVTLRVSATPLASLTGSDTDYANNAVYLWDARTTPLAEMGNLNVRLSFNIDPAPRKEPLDKPHYNFGFTMIGLVPYQYPNMTYTNEKRRPPQTVTRIPWKDGVAVGMNYTARETAFSWDESRSVWRWEGQFWIYERVYLSNTGGPTWRWNMRREYSPRPSNARRLYYSEADQRYHLWGASEGWMEAGHLVNQQKDLEYRWFDEDRDGYFDTVQVFAGDQPVPVRVSRFNPRARDVVLDREALSEEYNRRVLPRAIDEDQGLIAALKKFASSGAAPAYEVEAGKAEMPERRRYCLDIARELLFLKARDALYQNNASGPYSSPRLLESKSESMEAGSIETGYTLGDTLRYWKLASRINTFVEHYGQGRLGEAREALEKMQ